MIHSMLGLQPVAMLDTLFVDPVLPTWLPELVVHDLRLAEPAPRCDSGATSQAHRTERCFTSVARSVW